MIANASTTCGAAAALATNAQTSGHGRKPLSAPRRSGFAGPRNASSDRRVLAAPKTLPSTRATGRGTMGSGRRAKFAAPTATRTVPAMTTRIRRATGPSVPIDAPANAAAAPRKR